MKDIRKHYANTPRKNQQQTFETETPESLDVWEKPLYMFLDQASHTGYSIFDSESKLVLSGVMYHEPNIENKTTYVHEMVRVVTELCLEYGVEHLFHEEVFIGGSNVSLGTAESLHYIKSHIQDINHHHPHIKVYGLDVKKWKKELAKPDYYKFSKGTGRKKDNEEKKETLKHVEKVFPLISMYSDDETDAIGMGIAVTIKNQHRKNIYNITSYRKTLPIHMEIIDKSVDLKNPEVVQKLPVRFKRPANLGGTIFLQYDKRGNVEKDIRQFLSHKDSLLILDIPKTYKNWGFILLENNWTLDSITSEDKSYYVIASRKYRL